MKYQAMTPVDAAWLFVESDDTPMHTGVLAVFKTPRNAPEDYLSQLAENLRNYSDIPAPWNCRFSGWGGTAVLPRWVEVSRPDLDYHFQHSALPAPGGERELGIMVSRLHSAALDRERPLWEVHLIEGLERGRFAFYIKIHQALLDDVNAVPLALSMFSGSARRRNMPPLWSVPGNVHSAGTIDLDAETFLAELREKIPLAMESSVGFGKAVLGLFRAAVRPRKSGNFLWPAGAPRSTLNRRINRQRRFATQQIDLARIEALAQATDSTVNEILTYLCGTSLRRFFKEYNALPDEPLVGVVPISLQERGKKAPGNAIAAIGVDLGTHIGTPIARLRAIKKSLESVRKDRESLPAEAASTYALVRAMPIIVNQMTVVGQFVPPLFNLGISNTAGSDKPMYFNGSRLEAIYPMSQLMQNSALSVDCVNYAGMLNIGFTGARDTLPHLQRLAVYLGKAVEDLEDIIRSGEVAA